MGGTLLWLFIYEISLPKPRNVRFSDIFIFLSHNLVFRKQQNMNHYEKWEPRKIRKHHFFLTTRKRFFEIELQFIEITQISKPGGLNSRDPDFSICQDQLLKPVKIVLTNQ